MKRPFMVWIGFISICCSKVAKEGKSCSRLLVLQRVARNVGCKTVVFFVNRATGPNNNHTICSCPTLSLLLAFFLYVRPVFRCCLTHLTSFEQSL